MTLPTSSPGGPSAPIDPGLETAEPPPPSSGRKDKKADGQVADIWRRFRRNKLAMVGLTIVTLLMIIAIFEPILTPYSPFEQNLVNVLQPPSAQHWLGTDVLGRDLYSGIIYGTRLAMIVGVSTVAGSLIVGVTLGAIAGFKGGAWDAVISRITDIFLSFPGLIGAILVVRLFGDGVVPVIVALVVFGWTTAARLMRGQVLSLREAEYVEAARSIGAGNGRIIRRHILPNAIAPVFVYSFTSIGVTVVAMASLSFLGIGVPPDVPEWGRLISQAVGFLRVEGKSHLWLAPAGAIAITTLGFAFVADGLRDALDPKLRGGN
ncbi:ABC transporter permease [Pseudonocardia sp. GCM10023141]|uniref:ABC transporter permease n=1 Tax=Pseudonocardia sp. GCM10023141 TaxID=3252653 RepID=UPI003620F981